MFIVSNEQRKHTERYSCVVNADIMFSLQVLEELNVLISQHVELEHLSNCWRQRCSKAC